MGGANASTVDPPFDIEAASRALAPQSVSAPAKAATESGLGKELALRGFGVTIFRLLGIATAMLLNVVVARLLPPADFGLFSLLASVLAFASLAGMLGLNAAMIRFISESLGINDIGRARQALICGSRIALVTSLAAALACGAMLFWGGPRLFDLPTPGTIAVLMMICVVTLATLQLAASTLRALQSSGLATLLTGQFGGPISNLIFLGLIFCASRAGMSINLTVALLALSMIVVTPLAIYRLKRVTSARLPLTEKPGESTSLPSLNWKMLLATALPLAMTQMLSFATGNGDTWVAGMSVSASDVALYSAARRLVLLVGMPMQLVNLTVVAMIPNLRAQGRLVELERALRGAATVAAVPAVLALLPLILFPAESLALVYGEYYGAAAPLLIVLGVGQLVFTVVGSAEITLMMSGRHHATLVINLTTAVLLAMAGPFAADRLGTVGLAIAFAGITSIQSVLLCVAVRRLVGVWTLVDVRYLTHLKSISSPFKDRVRDAFIKAFRSARGVI